MCKLRAHLSSKTWLDLKSAKVLIYFLLTFSLLLTNLMVLTSVYCEAHDLIELPSLGLDPVSKELETNANILESLKIAKSRISPLHRLADKKLLECCAKGLTQNANESINGLIWQLCPKERFVGVETIETAVALVVCKFNDGAYSLKKKLLDHMRLREGHFTNLSLWYVPGSCLCSEV